MVLWLLVLVTIQVSKMFDEYKDQFSFRFCGFNWKSNLDYACFSHYPATSEGWDVSLDREEVRTASLMECGDSVQTCISDVNILPLILDFQ